MKKRRHVVSAEGAGPLVTALGQILAEPEATVRQRIEQGGAYVDGRRVKEPARAVRAGQVITVVLEESGEDVLQPAAPAPKLEVLHRDAWVLVVAKPVGLTAQPTPGRSGDSLLDLASALVDRPVGLVHRLDRETSGVTVFGMTREATSALAAAFREGTAKKRYLAACGPMLAAHGAGGEIDLPLSKDPSYPGRFRATRAAHGVSARTLWSRLWANDDHALVGLFPQTGRTHQLRAHLTALGAPICGDRRYGGQPQVAGAPAERCLLHAQGLELPHPQTGRAVLFEAPLPEDLARVFRSAGVTPPVGGWR